MTALLSLLYSMKRPSLEGAILVLLQRNLGKKTVNWVGFFFSFPLFMLQQAWLSEEAALSQYVLNCEHRILTFSAVRTEQMFTPRFWCGNLLIFLFIVFLTAALIWFLPVLCYCHNSPGHQIITEILDIHLRTLNVSLREKLWFLETVI